VHLAGAGLHTYAWTFLAFPPGLSFTSQTGKEAGRGRYTGGCTCQEDKLGGSESTIRPFFPRIREMHLFSNIFHMQRL